MRKTIEPHLPIVWSSNMKPTDKRSASDPWYHAASITRSDQFVRVQIRATCSRVFHVLTDEHGVRRPQLRPTIEEEPDLDIRRVIDKQGARPSSLIPVHKSRISDPLHDLQLLKDMKIINERTVREVGPLPPGGLPVQQKRKPRPWSPNLCGPMSAPADSENKSQEDEAMKVRHVAAVAVLTVAGTLVACDAQDQMATSSPKSAVTQSSSAPSSRTVATDSDQGQHESEMAPDNWQVKPQFRDAFEACWRIATTDQQKLACMEPELSYQDGVLNDAYKKLHEILGERDWQRLRNEQRQWLSQTNDSCQPGGVIAPMTVAQAYFCRLYRTADRANELQTIIELKRETH